MHLFALIPNQQQFRFCVVWLISCLCTRVMWGVAGIHTSSPFPDELMALCFISFTVFLQFLVDQS